MNQGSSYRGLPVKDRDSRQDGSYSAIGWLRNRRLVQILVATCWIFLLSLSLSVTAGPIAGYMGEDGGLLQVVQEDETVFLRLRGSEASSFGPERFTLTVEHLDAVSAVTPGLTTLDSPGEPNLILDRVGGTVTLRLDIESSPTVVLTQANLEDMVSRIEQLSPTHRLTAAEMQAEQRKALFLGGAFMLFGSFLLLAAARGWRFLNSDSRRINSRGPSSIPERIFLAVVGSILIFGSAVYSNPISSVN